jgi:putative membrane-bound dehydrogenase-like protein
MSGGFPLRTFASLLVLLALSMGSAHADDKLPTVPEGFVVELVAGPPVVERPVMGNFDERGRLYIVDSAGSNEPFKKLVETPPHRIVILEDTDADGRFDKRTVFADKLVMPQGVLPHAGAVYVASPPSVWKLVDTNGDDIADERIEIVTKFGSNGNAADIHGPTLGPDGWLYLCDGRHGHEVKLEDGSIDKAASGGIFRFRTDGTGFERICGGGFDNPVEIDFTREGDLVGTVNLLHGNPRQDCLMHWVEGGCYPRADQEHCLAEYQRTGDLLPPISELGHIALSGMLRFRGTSLGDEFDNRLFLTVFNTHKVITSDLTRFGSTFKSQESEFLSSTDLDFHPTDVIQDPTGGLLVVNTGGWFRIGCPTSQLAKPEIFGSIYRVRRADAPAVADPTGTALTFDKMPLAQVADRLEDPRPVVRERATARLAVKKFTSIGALSDVINGKRRDWSPTARVQAQWAVCRIWTEHRGVVRTSGVVTNKAVVEEARLRELVLRGLRDPDDAVRMIACHTAGLVRDRGCLEELSARVHGDLPQVQRSAATALGRILPGCPDATVQAGLDRLFSVIAAGPADRFVEHALLFAAIRVARPELTRTYLSHDSAAVRRGALIALDQMRDGNLTPDEITPQLAVDDEALRTTAILVLGKHSAGAAGLIGLARKWLAEPELSEERASVLRGVLLARIRDKEVQAYLGETLADAATPAPTRTLLWDVAHQSGVDPLPESWIVAAGKTLADGTGPARAQVLSLLQGNGAASLDEPVGRLADDVQVPTDVRVQALAVIAPRLASLETGRFELLVAALGGTESQFLALTAAEALSVSPLSNEQLLALAPRLATAGTLVVPRLVRAYGRATDESVGLALVSALAMAPADNVTGLDELRQVVAKYPEAVQVAAKPLLARASGGDPAEQAARIESFARLAEGGDVGRGKAVFFGQKAACGGCHAAENLGGRVGPDLSKIGGIRSGRDLLEAILYPSASFARDFRPVVIETNAGKVFTGVIARQSTEAVILKTADLKEIRIPRAAIEAMAESNLSIMPKGIETTLSEQELRDLMAYLLALK